MKLDDFLKCKKVRCLSNGYAFNEQGKAYKLHGLRVFITDETGCTAFLPIEDFEPVLDSAENPPQDVELTPEFEAVEPKFKAGDKVYFRFNKNIEEIERFFNFWDGIYAKSKSGNLCPLTTCCHANPENYAILSKLHPHIEFEQPPKPLTGIELAKKLIAKGHNYLVVDTVIGIRVLTRLEGNTLIDSNNVRLDELDDITPLNDETGEPLTQAVLDE